MSKKIFEKVSMRRPRMSAFDLSHEKKLSFKMGQLIPSLIEEVVPGDHFTGKTETLIRMAPMIAPVMHRVNVFVHYFFVPNRVTWNEWEDFITGGQDGTTAPVMPKVILNTVLTEGGLPDYMGLPTHQGQLSVNALPFWAYNQIYNDYYRDPNMENPVVLDTNQFSVGVVKYRSWEKDYFTSALPWPQRGPDVELPIEVDDYKPGLGQPGIVRDIITDQSVPSSGDLRTDAIGRLHGSTNVNRELYLHTTEGEINLTINELRESSALQRWLEKQARGGARYIETLLSHFGVRSSDKRLQRAEYLGGGKSPIVISEVLNTSATATEPQGNMAGHGVNSGVSNSFNYRVEEHGYIMGIMSVIPRTAYQNGVPRHFDREDKTEYYWPEFANLGEQEVKNREIFHADASDDGTFGYQQRYAEYKYSMDTVHGDFRDSLDFWHLGREFDTLPNLNATFNKAIPSDRIFAVQDNSDHLWAQIYNEVKARRPMPYFANPSLR